MKRGGSAKRRELRALLKKHGLEEKQVCFIPATNKFYCYEQTSLVKEYFRRYPLDEGCFILHDDGKAMYENGEDVFLEMGAVGAHAYTPEIHHVMSPNDNMYHGAAKRIWRTQDLDWKNDMETSLSLLSILTRQNEDEIKGYFDKNFFLEEGMVCGKDVCRSILSNGSTGVIRDNETFKRHLELYRTWNKGRGKRRLSDPIDEPLTLPTELDGTFWNKFY
jgi:hypothetical protein